MYRQNGLLDVYEAAAAPARPPLQSITTCDLPQTNTKPARIRATASGGSTMIVSKTGCEYFDAHAYAARMLADSLGWTDEFIPGAARDGYTFVVDCGVRV
jgi:hypothetical protein